MEELLKAILEEVKGIRSDVQGFIQQMEVDKVEAKKQTEEKLAKIKDNLPAHLKGMLG